MQCLWPGTERHNPHINASNGLPTWLPVRFFSSFPVGVSLILSFLRGFVLGCLPFGDSWCQNQPLGKHEEGKSKPRWARGPDWMGQAGPIQPMPKSCPAVLPESGSSFRTGPADPGASDSACPELPPASGKRQGVANYPPGR